MKTIFFVDLNARPLSFKEVEKSKVLEIAEEEGIEDVFALVNPDFKYFKTEKTATAFIQKFMEAEKALAKGRKSAKSPEAPCLIYKHNFLVMSAMKAKNQTVRSYKKPWKKGDLINLYDQTYYLTVKLTDIVLTTSGQYQYNFKPA